MVRKDVFDEVGLFDEDLPLAADLNMWCRIACAGYKIFYEAEPQNCMRVHLSSMTRQIYRSGEYGAQIFQCFQKVFEQTKSGVSLIGLRGMAARWPLRVELIYIGRSLACFDSSALKKHLKLLYAVIKWTGKIRSIPSLIFVILNLIASFWHNFFNKINNLTPACGRSLQ
jgi:hypothetical protein